MEGNKITSYKSIPVTTLIRNRETGLSRKTRRRGKQCVADFEFLRSLYCSKDSSLEQVFYTKVYRPMSPSFCHGRLFTENYHKWYNLHTSPYGRPQLMTEDIFKYSTLGPQSGILFELEPIRIEDAIAIHGEGQTSYMYLLSKRGWLYQVDLHTAEIVNSLCIPTRHFADMLYKWNDNIKLETDKNERATISPYRYIYITENRQTESIIVKSAQLKNISTGFSSTAFCIFKSHPLRIHCHFVATVSNAKSSAPSKFDIDSDMFILAVNTGSKVCFYSLDDVIKHFTLNRDINFNEKVKVRVGPQNRQRRAYIGDFDVGIPFTLSEVDVSSKKFLHNVPCLFQTKAAKFSLQIGGVPYHCLISNNKTGTSWSLRNFINGKDIAGKKLQISQRWDNSQWDSGVSVHCDDSGRFIKQNNSYIEVYQIEEAKKGKYKLTLWYKIDISPKLPEKNINNLNLLENVEDMPHCFTSHGRAIRKPRPFFSYNFMQESMSVLDLSYTLISVTYDHDLDVLGLLYYRPSGQCHEGWENEEHKSELVIAIHDNFSGSHLKSFIVEAGVSPCDRDTLTLLIRQETVVFTRFKPSDYKMEYQIFNLSRRN